MSGLAEILIKRGVKVSGSDMNKSSIIDNLVADGAKVYYGHSADNIENPDLVVYTAAVKDDNPELMRAREKGIKTIDRAEMLGSIMKEFKNAIGVAGTHGKTTTTSMLSYVLVENGTDPTITVGGELDIIGGNIRTGKSDYFLTEACEYTRSFLKFFPKIAVILNVDEDHLDYFKGMDDIIDAFSDFACLVPPDGTVVANADDPECLKAVEKAVAKVVTVGFSPDADYRAENVTYHDDGTAEFDIVDKSGEVHHESLSVIGKHNVTNALAAYACADALGLDKDITINALSHFGGTKRRYEKKGEVNGITVIDDYAHHPTEIIATLTSAKKIKKGDVWCLFQPHTYTRTKALLPEFAKALSNADKVIVADIYAAREKDTGVVSSKDVADLIDGAMYMKEFSKIADYVLQNAKDGDIVITMGAGDIYKVGEMMLGK